MLPERSRAGATQTDVSHVRNWGNRRLLALATVALVLRLALFCGGMSDPGRFMQPDSADYDMLALGLMYRGEYVRGSAPEIFRAPAYPAFLAAVYGIAGEHIPVVILLQVLADAALCVLLWRWAPAMVGSTPRGAEEGGPAPPCPPSPEAVSAWAMAWQTVAVVSAVLACQLLSDSLFALLLLCGLRVATAADRPLRTKRHEAGNGVVLGACFGLLGLWRAIALPFVAVLAVRELLRRRWLRCAALLAGWCLALSPWVTRNMVQAQYAGVSSVGATNLYRYNAAVVLARSNGLSLKDQQQLIDQELRRCRSQSEAARLARQRGMGTVLAAPLAAVWLNLKADVANLLPACGDMLRLFGVDVGGRGTLSVLRSQGLLAAVKHYFEGNLAAGLVCIPFAALLLAKYALAACGLWWALCRDRHDRNWLLCAAIAYFLLVPGAASHPRFRAAVEPLLSLYAGFGCAVLVQRWRHARNRARTEQSAEA